MMNIRSARAVATAAMSIGLLLATGTASAGQIGRITALEVRASDGLVYLTVEGERSGKPACATHDYWIVKAENSPAGQRQYAMLVAAKLSNAVVGIIGLGTCSRWGDGEDISSVILSN
jgi:hypothetical protein